MQIARPNIEQIGFVVRCLTDFKSGSIEGRRTKRDPEDHQAALCSSANGRIAVSASGDELPESFLDSVVLLRPGIVDLNQMTVREYAERMEKKAEDECSWDWHDENIYEMFCQYNKLILFQFHHDTKRGASLVVTYQYHLESELMNALLEGVPEEDIPYELIRQRIPALQLTMMLL